MNCKLEQWPKTPAHGATVPRAAAQVGSNQAGHGEELLQWVYCRMLLKGHNDDCEINILMDLQRSKMLQKKLWVKRDKRDGYGILEE